MKAIILSAGNELTSGQTVDTNARAIQASYLEEIRGFIEVYRRQCQGVRADFVTVHNAMTFDKALVQFLLQRQSRF